MSTMENKLLITLAEGYEQNPSGYITLSKETVDSSEARVVIADMRNQGYVDEQYRGVVRLTLRGYELFRNRFLISA
jgi:Mn-dependent DtxR family transcriptional regulator